MSKINKKLDQLAADSIKMNACAMIEKFGSRNYGSSIAAAKLLHTLIFYHLVFNPNDLNWVNRDRLIISDQQILPAYYAALRLCSIISKSDLENYGKSENTPYFLSTSKQTLTEVGFNNNGSAFCNGIGLAIAETMLANEHEEINHKTYIICNDEDMQRGNVQEALSLAGTLKLKNLIILYSSTEISKDSFTYSVNHEKTRAKYQAMGFNYHQINDEIKSINKAIKLAKSSRKPTLIEINTVLAKGTPYENTINGFHNKITKHDISNLKDTLLFKKSDNLETYSDLLDYYKNKIDQKIASHYNNWNCSSKLEQFLSNDFMINLNDLNTRKIDGDNDLYSLIINNISTKYSNIVFCSPNMENITKIKNISNVYAFNNKSGRNIYFGERHNCIGSVANGISLHSNFRPIISTLLEYAHNSIQAIIEAKKISLNPLYIFTKNTNYENTDITNSLNLIKDIDSICPITPYGIEEVKTCFENAINTSKNLPSILIADAKKKITNKFTNFDKSKFSSGSYYVVNHPNSYTLICSGLDFNLVYEIAQNLKLSLIVVNDFCGLKNTKYNIDKSIFISTDDFSNLNIAKHNVNKFNFTKLFKAKDTLEFNKENLTKFIEEIIKKQN
ncbi:hypothetical protein [Metamycoplasma hyosynoviae]|uniref:hypothetical protein n=1 Tax=Metamycoplasma hyosynoviae TaxID=29559 RepID=UPI00235E3A1D|nr:hypothetical protein [Metamycoplasma hyosynoviae]MDD1371625.1 hypothetical protein [Metamycoplasma hyosynoviae]MDD7837631.1 hypothetical protein [Metamycoplasma hyosynoviae]